MIDHIGGKHVSIRKRDNNLVIRSLDNNQELELGAEAWLELMGLMVAVKATVDFRDQYEVQMR